MFRRKRPSVDTPAPPEALNAAYRAMVEDRNRRDGAGAEPTQQTASPRRRLTWEEMTREERDIEIRRRGHPPRRARWETLTPEQRGDYIAFWGEPPPGAPGVKGGPSNPGGSVGGSYSGL